MRATEEQLREALQACISALEAAQQAHKQAGSVVGEVRAYDLRNRIRELLAGQPEETSGWCEEKKKPGGCQLHNLHCGYPNCDIKKE